ncbi:MAG: UbiA family prenyltransferase [Gammaproteobacteria bacterium]
MAVSDIPLCVDLDGTLIRTDLLMESALQLLHKNPLNLFRFMVWTTKGKAHLKRQIASRTRFDAAYLPYNTEFLEWMRQTANGRELVLCTASDQLLAEAVAGHVGGFQLVLGSDGNHNLSGVNKAMALSKRFGERGFDYAGDNWKDLPVWQCARRAIVVNASRRFVRAAGHVCEVECVIEKKRPYIVQWRKALRLHQWIKNTLVFLPLLAGHRLFNMHDALMVTGSFLSFGLLASATYVINDLLDLDSDRHHPRKLNRPFAAGTLPLSHGLIAGPILGVIALYLAYLLSGLFTLVLLLYLVLTLGYSFRWKRIVMLDVVILAGLYTTRIIAGTVIIGAELSFWLLAFSMFIFLSLAMLKRYAELLALRTEIGETNAIVGRAYTIEDLPLVQTLGSTAGYLSVLVLALYINSEASRQLYRHPQILWLLCPVLLYWISRIWIVTHRGEMHDDPVIYAVTDRISLAVLLIGALAVILAI